MLSQEDSRRRNDVLVGELIGKFDQFMKEYERDIEESNNRRVNIENRLSAIESFLEEIKSPHKVIVWLIRIISIAAIGVLVTGLFNYFNSHFKWN